MIILTIGVVIFLSCLGCLFYKLSWKYDKEPIFFGTVVSVLLTLIIMFVVNVAVSITGTPVMKERPIYSLERSDSVSGSFFLGTGSVNSKPIYYFYMSVGKDEYVINSANAISTTLALSNTTIPHIEYYNKACIKEWLCSARHKTVITKITVPVNTIKKGYNVN